MLFRHVHHSHHNDTGLTAIFPDNPCNLVPECLYSGFYWS